MIDRLHPEDLKVLQRMHRWKLAFYGLVIMIAGIVIGVAAAMLWIKPNPKRVEHGPETMNRRMMERTIKMMRDELGLTAEQEAQLGPIMNENFKALDEIRKEARPKIVAQMNKLNQQITAVLDEQQLKAWQEGIKQLRDKFPNHPDFMPGSGRGRQRGSERGPGRGNSRGSEDGKGSRRGERPGRQRPEGQDKFWDPNRLPEHWQPLKEGRQ